MARLDPVIRLSGNRLAIVYPREGAKIIQIEENGNPGAILALSSQQLKRMADAEWLPDTISFDEGLAIVLVWMSICEREKA